MEGLIEAIEEYCKLNIMTTNDLDWWPDSLEEGESYVFWDTLAEDRIRNLSNYSTYLEDQLRHTFKNSKSFKYGFWDTFQHYLFENVLKFEDLTLVIDYSISEFVIDYGDALNFDEIMYANFPPTGLRKYEDNEVNDVVDYDNTYKRLERDGRDMLDHDSGGRWHIDID